MGSSHLAPLPAWALVLSGAQQQMSQCRVPFAGSGSSVLSPNVATRVEARAPSVHPVSGASDHDSASALWECGKTPHTGVSRDLGWPELTVPPRPAENEAGIAIQVSPKRKLAC